MYKKSFQVVKWIGAAIMLLLVLSALTDSWYMLPGEEEVSLHRADNVLGNLLSLAGAVAVFAGLQLLEKKLTPKKGRILSEIVAAGTAVWMLLFSLWWIFSAKRLPVGDQAYLYAGASYFRQGDYAFLQPGGYYHIYPYQLGLTAFMELLYHIAEPFSYRPLQGINAAAVVGILYTGHRLVREWTKSIAAELFFCLLAGCCLPLLFYTPWVYGEIVSIFFVLLAALLLTRYEEAAGNRRCVYLVGTTAALTMAQLTRQSTTIVLIAVCLLAAVDFLKKPQEKGQAALRRKGQLGIAAVCSVLLPVLLFQGIYRMYEDRSGIAHSKGVPTVVTLAMGMQEGRSGCGWDNNYQKTVYNEAVFDYDVMQEMGKQSLQETLTEWKKHPAQAVSFYGKKLLSQWNAPLYQSLFFNADYRQSDAPKEGSLAQRISESDFWGILVFCDRLQFVVYAGMFFWFLFDVKEEKGCLRLLLSVAVIGGFFFSLLWEAKTRYILPYYLFMYPCAAAGYGTFYGRLCQSLKNRRREKQKTKA